MPAPRRTATRELWSEPAALAVEDQLFRALAVLRWVVLANAVGFNLWRHEALGHLVPGLLVLLGLTLWTGFATWAYREAARRTPALLVADLVIAVAAMLVSPLIKGPHLTATIPGFWVMGALLAWAIHWRWRGGLFAASCLSAADLAIRDHISESNYGNVFLLMIGGPIVGYMCESLQRLSADRDRAERAAAAAEERARLARAVHDGVLQVLTLMQRRGAELGGELGDLGRMAEVQESALRSLIRQQDAVPAEGARAGDLDLTAELERLEAGRPPVVSVATPGAPIRLPAERVRQLVAVVRACLDNVALHVGPDAPAWVLLDRDGDRLVLTVRDEGLGIPDGRLDAAAAEGRLGVKDSILGRVAELGGRAELTTSGHGTEWEFTFSVASGR